jgi:glycosyltransferase involved in cell wall biosynthesis
MSKYRVGIDCRLAGQRHAGIGRYIVELVKRVTAHTEIDWVLFYSDFDQIHQIFPSSKPPKNCTLIHTPVQHYTISEQFKMNSIFTKASLDLLHVPHFNIPILYSRPLVITIHDLLWHEHRGSDVTTLSPWKYWIKYSFYRFVTRIAINKAVRIVVPTNAVKDTLKKYFPNSNAKMIITPEGISETLLQVAKSAKRIARNQEQLLYVGSLYPHKNVQLILHALPLLPSFSLTIVSSRSVFRKKLEQLVDSLQLKNRVSFLSNVSDEELSSLYQTSAALIQPSFSEGFGLTGLEAMAFKTPVVASDIRVFHEVYENAAMYFDPHSVEDFCKTINKLSDTDMVKKISAAAPAIVKKNNWDDMSAKTYLCYTSVLNYDHARK